MTEVNDKNIKDGTLKTIPMGYLRKGDRFVAMLSPSPGKGRVVLAGVANMDGQWVSEDYGFRGGHSERYLDPQNEYINVHLDGVDYSNWQSDRTRQCNTGMYARDEWSFYVTPDLWVRYSADFAQNERIKAEREQAKKDAAAALEAAEAQARADTAERKRAAQKGLLVTRLAALEREVGSIKDKIAEME